MPAKSQKNPSTIVVGGLHVDEIARLESEFVERASNPVRWQRYVGGVSSNAARAIQTHYESVGRGTVSLHCALGRDAHGQSLAVAMRSLGIEVEPHWMDSNTTDRYSAILSTSGELVMGLADIRLAEDLSPAAPITALLSRGSTEMLLDANVSVACINTLLQAAKETSTYVSAMAVSPTKALKLLPNASQINLLFCNRREALSLAIASGLLRADTRTDQIDILLLSQALTEAGFRKFVLTDGDAELIVGKNGCYTSHSTPPTSISHNVNGAGDTLAGASFAALTLGASLESAVVNYGMPMAAQVITGKRLPLPL